MFCTMTMPSIHDCFHLSTENERITKKYRKLQRRNNKLEQELGNLKEQFLHRISPEREKRIGKSVQVQTEGRRAMVQSSAPHTSAIPRQRVALDDQMEKTSKMITMHSNLMKRYEKELKTNTAQVEKIATLSIENRDLEQKVRELQGRISELEQNNETLQSRLNTASTRDRITPSKRDLMAELVKLKRDRENLAADKKKLKDELKGLDRGFFEEVEDLKYALQQSARLNTAYEKAMRKLCSQFGVPFPKITNLSPKQHRERDRNREFKSNQRLRPRR